MEQSLDEPSSSKSEVTESRSVEPPDVGVLIAVAESDGANVVLSVDIVLLVSLPSDAFLTKAQGKIIEWKDI